MKILFFISIVLGASHFVKASKVGTAYYDDSLKPIYADTSLVHPSCFVVMKIGDKIPAIFLYDTLGKKVPVTALFKGEKPVVFINGSYSCFIFRRNIKRINKFVKEYKGNYDIYFVYVQEAHPLSCSPYGEINENLEINNKKGIKIEQPVYYKDRVYYAKKTKKDLHLNVPVLIDNEYNDFFTSIFAGPNGYLMFSKDKVLVEQRKWYFNKKNRRRLFWQKVLHKNKK